jgi:hypothetical protein
MRTRRLAALALLALPAGAAVGCGDEEDRLTAAELAEQGNGICEDVDEEFEAAFAEVGDEEPTPDQMQEFAATAAQITGDAIARFEDLEPPEDLEQDWNDTLEAARAAHAQLEDAGESPEAAAALFSSEEDPFDEVNAGLEGVGITACSDE